MDRIERCWIIKQYTKYAEIDAEQDEWVLKYKQKMHQILNPQNSKCIKL